ncbi:MAG: EamA family transporter [Anaerolineales bacterium]|nr:DMT family transporter [Anaerolineae bacterium]PWB52252.1 MAG: EamA family transporter [Anaerolineales bacterium]
MSSWATMNPNIGELAALLTAMCYSISSIFFTVAGRKFGPAVSNRVRLVVAILLLCSVHWLIYGTPLPVNAEVERWFWLGISGIVGLAIGDLFLFKAYISMGPRIGLLFLSLAPAIATLLAWVFLGETLSVGSIFGIILTLAGITWVVLVSNSRSETQQTVERSIASRIDAKGVLAGLIAASGQALGVVLAKNGLKGNFPALSANVIRMSAAFLAFWLVTILQRQVVSTIQRVKDQRSGMVYILGGALFGPLIGVSLSLFAIQNTSIGIASTIIALPPIFLLPIGHFVFKEKISWQAVTGTIVAVTGVAMLFWL